MLEKIAMTPIRLVIADDHAVVQHGLTAILCRQPHLSVVASCSNGAQAYKAIKNLTPDIALLGLSMPSLTGLEVLAAAQSEKLTTRIVILAARFDDETLRTAMAGGAFGLVLRDAGIDEYLDCVADVFRGDKWISPALLNRISAALKKPCANQKTALGNLTRREHEILKLMQHGLTNKAIANKMNISQGTVKVHLHNIYRKAAVPNRTALAAIALSSNEFPSEPD